MKEAKTKKCKTCGREFREERELLVRLAKTMVIIKELGEECFHCSKKWIKEHLPVIFGAMKVLAEEGEKECEIKDKLIKLKDKKRGGKDGKKKDS